MEPETMMKFIGLAATTLMLSTGLAQAQVQLNAYADKDGYIDVQNLRAAGEHVPGRR
jgi:hypothetical protein